jgi:hypothetical protein|nr:MAG TPA: hypothetical protein [Caudoviricetes sp.]
MKKVLCDKDGKFISIHDGDYYLMELNDGDCLTHEDGTILIYRKCEREDTKVAYHAFLRYGEEPLHIHQNGDLFTHYNLIPTYRLSTVEEKKRINDVLSENGVYYDEKEKCLKKLRWRAIIGNSYYYINFDSFEVFIETESDFSEDNKRYKNLNYFQTKEEAEKKLFEVKAVLND